MQSRVEATEAANSEEAIGDQAVWKSAGKPRSGSKAPSLAGRAPQNCSTWNNLRRFRKAPPAGGKEPSSRRKIQPRDEAFVHQAPKCSTWNIFVRVRLLREGQRLSRMRGAEASPPEKCSTWNIFRPGHSKRHSENPTPISQSLPGNPVQYRRESSAQRQTASTCCCVGFAARCSHRYFGSGISPFVSCSQISSSCCSRFSDE